MNGSARSDSDVTLNTHAGELINEPVAQAHQLPHRPLAELLA